MTDQITVDDVSYDIFPLTGRQGLQWPYRLAKYMKGFIPAEGGSLDLTKALTSFFEECSEENFIQFAEGMLDTTHRNGQSMKGKYVVDFKGNPQGLFRLLIEICRFHFSGFFSELESLKSSGLEQSQTGNRVRMAD